jgi:hypothetical protein
MYNNGGAASVITGGTLAATGAGISPLHVVGLAILAIGLCLTGLLLLRAHRLRSQRPANQ